MTNTFDQLLGFFGGFYFGLLLMGIAANAFLAWAGYMFYRCFRDTADELRKLRVSYDMNSDATRRERPLRPTN